VEEIITPTQAFELMVGYLRENGFEVGELEGMER
jgi:hypothetical protein